MTIVYVLAGIVSLFFTLLGVCTLIVKEDIESVKYYADLPGIRIRIALAFVFDVILFAFGMLNYLIGNMIDEADLFKPCVIIFAIGFAITLLFQIIYFLVRIKYFIMYAALKKAYYKEKSTHESDKYFSRDKDKFHCFKKKSIFKDKPEYLKYFKEENAK